MISKLSFVRDWLRKKWVPFFMAIVIASPSLAEDCLDSVSVDDPDIKKIDRNYSASMPPLGEMPVRQIKYEFLPVAQNGREYVSIREIIVSDITQPLRFAKSVIQRQVAAEASCQLRLGSGSFEFSVLPNGNLYTEVPLPTTIRVCAKFTWVCSKGLKFYRCTQEWSTNVDRTTFQLKVWLERRVLNNELIIAGRSEFDDRGYKSHPIRNLLINIVGISTLNVGSKFLLDKYRAVLGQIRLRLAKAQPFPPLPSLSHDLISRQLPEGSLRDLVDNLVMNETETRFTLSTAGVNTPNSYPALRAVFDSPRIRKNTFCSLVKPYFRQMEALLRSTREGDVTHTIAKGESLWTISSKFYGDGHYHLALLRPNDLAIVRMNMLRPGDTLVVPAMYKLWQGPDYLTSRGDSLWGISRERLGDGRNSHNLYRSNSRFLESPNRIYPIQMLELPQ